MDILIDYREIQIINKCNEINFSITTQNLLIGDIIFKTAEQTLLIIERKTLSDLSSSITDGRWREQKSRLKESQSKILYIIEDECKGRLLDQKIIDSSLLNTLLRDNFFVYFSKNVNHTVNILKLLKDKFINNDFEFKGNIINEIKKSTKILDNIFIHQLNVIPGVSLNIAKKINEKYTSFKILIKLFEENGQEALSELQITEKRKLGKQISIKIYNSLS